MGRFVIDYANPADQIAGGKLVTRTKWLVRF